MNGFPQLILRGRKCYPGSGFGRLPQPCQLCAKWGKKSPSLGGMLPQWSEIMPTEYSAEQVTQAGVCDVMMMTVSSTTFKIVD